MPLSGRVRQRTRPVPRRAPWSPRSLAVLLGITVVAAILRLWQIELWSVSPEEAASWQQAMSSERSGLIATLLGLGFEHGWLPTHGEGWLRLPFAFCGLCAVPLLAFVGAAMFSRPAGVLAAAFLAVHPWHIEISQAATGYGPALTCSLAAFGAAWLGRESGRRSPWLLAAVAAVLAGLCHPSGWLSVHVLLVCWRLDDSGEAGPRDRITALVGAVLLLIATIGIVMVSRPITALSAADGAAVEWGGLAMAIRLPVLLVAALPVLASSSPSYAMRCVLAAVMTPLVVAMALGFTVLPITADDLLICLPPLLLLAALGVVQAFEQLRAALGGGRGFAVLLPSAMIGLVVLVELLVGMFLYSMAQHGRSDWRGVRDTVVRSAERQQLSVLAGVGHDSLLYYLRPGHWRQAAQDPHPGIGVERLAIAAPRLQERLVAAEDQDAELFVAVLEAELAELRRDADTAAALAGSFELIEVLPNAGEHQGGAIHVFRRR